MMRNLAPLLVAVVSAGALFADTQVSVPDMNASPGSSLVVPIAISQGRNVTGVQFTLTWDANLLSVRGDSEVLAGDALTGHSLGINRQRGSLKVVILSTSLASLRDGSGSLVNVIFRASGSATLGGSTGLQLSDLQIADVNGGRVSAIARSGTVSFTNGAAVPVDGTNKLIFPQVVNGPFPGGSYMTALILVNRTGVTTAGAARFLTSSGEEMPVRLTDGRSGSSFSFTAPDTGATLLQTDGTGTFGVGYAEVSSSGPLGGTVLFSQLDSGVRAVAETGVGNSAQATHFSVPVLYVRNQADTGIAFANPGAETVELTLTLRDRQGVSLGSSTVPLPAGQHLPKFASEFFSILLTKTDFNGSIEASATAPVSAIALKLQGTLLTTFPVVELR